jgi:hypothetical protein
LPFVFTEHGAIMAANVLNNEHVVQMGVFIVRGGCAFGAGRKLQRPLL